MKWATLLLLCSSCLADSIPLPVGGFAWVTGQITVGNIEGEYSPTMPLIYALQFGGASSFYLKVNDVAYNGTFSNWSFSDGLFRGTFTGTEFDFYHNTFMVRGEQIISGVLTQQLNLLAGCQGYHCGAMGAGQLAVSTVPEPSSALLMLTSALAFAAVYRKRFAQ